jgi:hypothetical protein
MTNNDKRRKICALFIDEGLCVVGTLCCFVAGCITAEEGTKQRVFPFEENQPVGWKIEKKSSAQPPLNIRRQGGWERQDGAESGSFQTPLIFDDVKTIRDLFDKGYSDDQEQIPFHRS